MNENFKFILVHYIDIRNVAKEDVRMHIEQMKSEFLESPKLKDQVLYFIPIMGESKVECIYPPSHCNCK